MAEASIDIRVFPNKELTSVDFAELMDTAIFNTGVIQGCSVTELNGVLNISSGRLVVQGRLGVVTGGTIPIPTGIDKKQNCWLMAVCDLSSKERPFYFLLATANDLDRLGIATGNDKPTFNVENGINAVTLGACEFDPATGLVSNYATMPQGYARKGWDWYNNLYEQIIDLETSVNNKLTWKSVQAADYQGTAFHRIPDGAKEIYVVIWIRWISTGDTQKTSIGFHIPVEDTLFVSSANLVGHVNHWTKTNDGFVRLRLVKNNEGYFVKIYNVYQGDTDVTNSAYWRILYR